MGTLSIFFKLTKEDMGHCAERCLLTVVHSSIRMHKNVEVILS